jgi:Lrp/AsnC family leucine-responsive transcriptional regulator
MNLKKRDKRLLYEYCRNSRRPFTVLARKSRMSQQLVSYKIKAMKEAGIITQSYPLIDYSMFGLLQFYVHFRINYRSRKSFQDLVSRIQRHESVVEVTVRSGHYDLIVTFMSKNPSSFNKTLRRLIEKNPDQLKNHIILTNVVSHYFPKKYMVGLEGSIKDSIIGGDREPAIITETDKKVLELLVKDARSRTVDIAAKVKINPRTVVAVIKRLKKVGILQGFSSLLNFRLAGFQRRMMLIKYHNLSIEQEDNLRRFCITHKNITGMHKLFGDYDVAITAEADSAMDLRKVFINIRETFEDIINDSDSFNLYSTFKITFLPESFFK